MKKIVFVVDVNGGEYHSEIVMFGEFAKVGKMFEDEDGWMRYPVEVDGREIWFDEPVVAIYVGDELIYTR